MSAPEKRAVGRHPLVLLPLEDGGRAQGVFPSKDKAGVAGRIDTDHPELLNKLAEEVGAGAPGLGRFMGTEPYEVDKLDLLPNTPAAQQGSTANTDKTPKAKLLTGVLKSTASSRTLDLGHLTRKAAFEAKLTGALQMEEAIAAAKKLQDDTDVDDLAKFKRSNSKAGLAKAATAYVKSSTNANWVPTLLAVKGRAWPISPMFACMSIATGVTCVEKLYLTNSKHFTKEACKEDPEELCWPYSLETPYQTVSVVGAALFFLMVFRTNASYDRWWEGRKKWGMIINRTRDFARQTCGFVDEHFLVDNMVRWTVAFAVCTKRHLRFERELDELEGKLAADEIERIQEAKHMPLYCLERLTTYTRTALESPRNKLMSDITFAAMDANLTQFEDELGACERILKTPFPYAYVVHLRTFMTLWLTALPFALLSSCGWLTIPTVAMVAYALLGIETIGVEIENPFGHDFNDLPLDTICDTISTNLFELLARRDKSLASEAEEQRTLATKVEQIYTTLQGQDGPDGAKTIDPAVLCAALQPLLDTGVALKPGGLLSFIEQLQREPSVDFCQARVVTSGDGKETIQLNGVADLRTLCNFVIKASS